jgi:hypothetical protein
VVSDTVSNSLRVVKTYRQVHEKNVGYCTSFLEINATSLTSSDCCERDHRCGGCIGVIRKGFAYSAIDQWITGIVVQCTMETVQ